MYLRPRTLAEKFLVAEKVTRLNEIGRAKVEFHLTGEIIFGILSETRPEEVEKYKATHHEVTHVLVSRSNKRAKIGDILIKVDKKYLVQNVEEIGAWTNYFICERADL